MCHYRTRPEWFYIYRTDTTDTTRMYLSLKCRIMPKVTCLSPLALSAGIPLFVMLQSKRSFKSWCFLASSTTLEIPRIDVHKLAGRRPAMNQTHCAHICWSTKYRCVFLSRAVLCDARNAEYWWIRDEWQKLRNKELRLAGYNILFPWSYTSFHGDPAAGNLGWQKTSPEAAYQK